MTNGLKDEFLKLRTKRFGGAELPIAFFHTDDDSVPGPARMEGRCLFAGRIR